jgi:hypothetical protein
MAKSGQPRKALPSSGLRATFSPKGRRLEIADG